MTTYFQKFLRVFFLFWFRVRHVRFVVEGSEHIPRHRTAVIIAANHRSALDPFVLGAALPRELYPVHFLGARWFGSPILYFFALIGVVPLFYALCGVVTVYRGMGLEKNIAPALEILKKGGVIAIFPEGKRNHTDTIQPFKRGVAVLLRMSHAPVLPLYITYRKTRIRVVAGPLVYATARESEEDTLKRIYTACKALV